MKKIVFDNLPEQAAFNQALASRTSDELHKILDLIDNEVKKAREVKKNDKKVIISIKQMSDGLIHMRIEDNLGGVENIIEQILKITIRHNECYESQYAHGGKQSLEGLTIDGGRWSIFSRTQEMVRKGEYIYVDGPYDFKPIQYMIEASDNIEWIGELKEAGTLIDLFINRKIIKSFINGVEKDFGVVGVKKDDTNQIVLDMCDDELNKFYNYLVECIREFYTGVLKENLLDIIIRFNKQEEQIKYYDCIDWIGSAETISDKVDLGGGDVELNIKYGLINPSYNKLFYTCNTSNSGLFISINGRMYECGRWIWKEKRDNHHRFFLCMVEINSNHKNRLPRPNVDKSGLLETDDRCIKLLEIIGKYIPKALRDDVDKKKYEEEKKKLLIKYLKDKYGEAIKVDDEYLVGKEFNVIGNNRVDIRTCLHGAVTYYELKHCALQKGILEQMLRYITFAISDGDKVDKFIIVAERYSWELEEDLIKVGKLFGIEVECKKWNDYGINTKKEIVLDKK